MVGCQVLSRPSAAEGGGRRPAFTGPATQPYSATEVDGWQQLSRVSQNRAAVQEHPSVAILEAARFALMRHFLRPEQLLSRQALGDEVPVSGRQLAVLIGGNCRGEVVPHVGAHAVLRYSAPLLEHDAEVELRFGIALFGRQAIPLHRFS